MSVYDKNRFGATHTVHEFFVTVTPSVGDYAGQSVTIPAKSVIPTLKQVQQTSIKDNHNITYAKHELSETDSSDKVECIFEGLERKHTKVLQDMQSSATGSLIEFTIEHPGKDERSTEGFIENPSVNGAIQIGGKGQFTLTFEGDIQDKPAA